MMQVWILKGRNDELYRGMWVRAMDEMIERLVGFAENDQLQYVGDMSGYVLAPVSSASVVPVYGLLILFPKRKTQQQQNHNIQCDAQACRQLKSDQ